MGTKNSKCMSLCEDAAKITIITNRIVKPLLKCMRASTGQILSATHFLLLLSCCYVFVFCPVFVFFFALFGCRCDREMLKISCDGQLSSKNCAAQFLCERIVFSVCFRRFGFVECGIQPGKRCRNADNSKLQQHSTRSDSTHHHFSRVKIVLNCMHRMVCHFAQHNKQNKTKNQIYLIAVSWE